MKTMKSEKENSLFSTLFVPQYDELSLFSMGYILILLIFFNSKHSTWNFLSWSGEPLSFFIMLPFIIGMILCMYHAFTDRRKTNFEKKLMMFFAAILNGFSGLWYGTYILVHHPGWGLTLFPIWNIFSGFILISLLRDHSFNFEEKVISDKNISLKKLLIGVFIVTILFLICELYFQLVWAATFSICMVWISNLGKTINSVLIKLDITIY